MSCEEVLQFVKEGKVLITSESNGIVRV